MGGAPPCHDITKESDRWPTPTPTPKPWPPVSRSTARGCVPSPTGCSARPRRPTTRCRRRGSGSGAPARPATPTHPPPAVGLPRVVPRISLNALRARATRREDPLEVQEDVRGEGPVDPADEAVTSD